MDLVKVTALSLLAAGLVTAADFSIEIGSPVAAGDKVVTKVKAAAFSVRTHECASATGAKFSGSAVWMNGTKRESSPLVFTRGTAAGAFVVARADYNMEGPWLAVITAECSDAKAGALVPVAAYGVYNRTASKFLSRLPTEAEITEALKGVK